MRAGAFPKTSVFWESFHRPEIGGVPRVKKIFMEKNTKKNVDSLKKELYPVCNVYMEAFFKDNRVLEWVFLKR
jgi:hypothetical protein